MATAGKRKRRVWDTYAFPGFHPLAFGVGLTLWTLRQSLSRRPGGDPPGMLADFWRTSVLFQSGREARRRLEAWSVA